MSAQHFSKNVLTESVWITLNEDTRNYLREWDEVAQLINENIDLFEAELTAQQIDALFKGAEQYAIDSGEFQTGLGKAGNAAASAGAAVAGTVKVGADVVRQVNNKINQLGKMIQDTTPVQNIDAAFEKAKKDMYDKLGGQDSKVNQIVTKLSDVAKAHPGAAKFAVGLLTAAASIAAGPAGGAAAGFLLRMGNDLLAGEKLSTAVGKSAKTAAAGFLAGKAADAVKDMFAGDPAAMVAAADNPEQVQQIASQIKADPEQVQDFLSQGGAGADAATDAAAGATKELTGKAALDAMGDSVAMVNPVDVDLSQLADIEANSREMRRALKDLVPSEVLSDVRTMMGKGVDPDIIEKFLQTGVNPNNVRNLMPAELTAMLQNGMSEMELTSLLKGMGEEQASSWVQAAKSAMNAAAGAPNTVVNSIEIDASNAIYETIYVKHLAGLALTESEQKIVNEIGWADIKKGAAKAAGAVGAAAGKAGAAVAKGAKAVGKELGQQITARKLNQMWSKAGKPTDAASVFGVLQAAGMDNKALQAVSQQTNIKFEKPAPASKPGQGDSTSGDGGSAEVDRAPGAQVPSPGATPKPAQAPKPAQPAQTPEPAQPAGDAQPAQTPEPAQPAGAPKKPGMTSRIGQAVAGMAKKGAAAAGKAAGTVGRAAAGAAAGAVAGAKAGAAAGGQAGAPAPAPGKPAAPTPGKPAAPAPGKPAAPTPGKPAAPAPGKPAAPAQPATPNTLGQQNVDAANKAQADIDAEKPAAKKPGFDKATFQARADRGRARKAKIVRNDIHSDDETDESEDK